MGYLIGVVVLVVGLLVSIALHEVGHMVPAKAFGVRVSQYMVGFGPTLWSRTRGETEYGLKAIPLGGYVRLVGMYPPAPPGTVPRAGRIAQLVQDTREISAEEIFPGQEHRAMYNLSAPKKIVVMFAGPFMNLLIALVLTGVVLVGFGVPAASTTVASVVPCVPETTASGSACADDATASPASAAGLLPGDTIVELDGMPTDTWDELTEAIAGAADRPTSVVVERAGERVTLPIEPVTATRTVVDAAGEPVVGDDGVDLVVTSGFVGIAPTTVTQHAPLSQVPAATWDQVTATAGIVVTLPARVLDVATTLVTGGERGQDSVMSVVGVGRIAGEIGAADNPAVTTADRVAGWLSLLAALNVALFVFNLVPLLPLDGGHILGAVYEGLRRQLARVRRRPLPGPADTARMMPLAYGVFVALIGVTLVLFVADLVRPITLG